MWAELVGREGTSNTVRNSQMLPVGFPQIHCACANDESVPVGSAAAFKDSGHAASNAVASVINPVRSLLLTIECHRPRSAGNLITVATSAANALKALELFD